MIFLASSLFQSSYLLCIIFSFVNFIHSYYITNFYYLFLFVLLLSANLLFPFSSLYLMYCHILIVSMMLTVTPSHASEMNEILMRIYLKKLSWCLLCPWSDSKKNSKPLLCRTLLKKYNKFFLAESATVFYLVIEDSAGWTRSGGLWGHKRDRDREK